MIPRRALLVLALAAGVLAGGIYYVSAQRTSVVVAARDLEAVRPLTREDLETREFPLDAVPDGTFADPAQLLGRVPRAPLWRGQILIAQAVGESAAVFRSGLVPAPGTRAIALPVGAVQALGGAIAPGARVDVVAVPIAGRAPEDRETELLGTSVLVLDVRGEHGGVFSPAPASGRAAAVSPERLGSVVVAISPQDSVRYAERIVTSSFVLVLVPDR